MSSDPIQYTIEQFAQLPGIGERTALRLVLHLVAQDRSLIARLSDALVQLDQKVHECEQCHMITAMGPRCSICVSHSRDAKTLCVVARVQDLMALEATSEFRGFYHVLHGVLAPMEGIGPGDLRIATLLQRLVGGLVEEIILATPSTVEGEATALYLAQELAPHSIKITRIASGVPVGGDLQFSDRLTLSRAMALRRGF
ncbi:MAG: recombination mediator RecR [Myxococcaceae bacterium]